jgi:hypothetical protein
MRLQHKLSNGSYINIGPEREADFVGLALNFDKRLPDEYSGKRHFQNQQDVLAALESGEELQYGTDWYDKIRDGEAYERRLAEARSKRTSDPNFSSEGWRLDCGCQVYSRSRIMDTSSGTSCPRCYDRMSN